MEAGNIKVSLNDMGLAFLQTSFGNVGHAHWKAQVTVTCQVVPHVLRVKRAACDLVCLAVKHGTSEKVLEHLGLFVCINAAVHLYTMF